MTKSLSIVIPFFNEEDCARQVLEEVRAAHPEAELVAVDDGSSDATLQRLREVDGVKILAFTANRGQSAALYAGLRAATGEILAMMDGDGQNDPSDIGKLVAALARADVAYGVRIDRKDPAARIVAGRIANAIRNALLGDGATDAGCTLKVIRREHVELLVPFDGMHRYFTVFFARSGLKAEEVPVNHRPRRTGASKYTLGARAWRGVGDLLGVRRLLAGRADPPRPRSTECMTARVPHRAGE